MCARMRARPEAQSNRGANSADSPTTSQQTRACRASSLLAGMSAQMAGTNRIRGCTLHISSWTSFLPRTPSASGRNSSMSPKKKMKATASDAIAAAITEKTGLEVTQSDTIGSSGWSSQVVCTTDDGTKYFAKTSSRSAKEMFEGEALGLQAMFDTHTLRVPEVIAYEDYANGSYLITEYLKFGGRCDQAELGRQLARMHKATPKEAEGRFGFPIDNTIGGTSQPNKWETDWVTFYREHRLLHQVQLANDRKITELAAPVIQNLEVLFDGIEVKPSVLHGDLWSGNMAGVEGAPAVFDPAVYYGHSEAEFGMSWCAGFTNAFYHAYHEELPKQPGFEKRRDLYLLYHYLNHYNLFGSGYRGECVRLLEKLRKHVQNSKTLTQGRRVRILCQRSTRFMWQHVCSFRATVSGSTRFRQLNI
eukprot:TRINITY_DN9022_c0_g1_i1.p1 TRINITY_DN9022_c0_g1~~TRINITY_DN9022_c0_g1_i1.p1  ORF type:complete len:419 (-),score=21.38 TRINITY_DN9022_c0_g1_i1:53-1309(-)